MKTSLSPNQTANISISIIIRLSMVSIAEHDERQAERDGHERPDQQREEHDAEPGAARPSLATRLRVRHVRGAERAEAALTFVELGVHAPELADHRVLAGSCRPASTTNRNSSPPAPFTVAVREMLSLWSALTSPSG